MLTILSLKIPSGKPTDAVDTVNHNVFSRLTDSIQFIEGRSWLEIIRLARRLRPDYALGIGSVGEILLLPFLPRKTRYGIAWHTLLRKTLAWPVRIWLFQTAHFVIAVSTCAAQTVKNFFPEKQVAVVLNGVDTDFFTPQKANKHFFEKFGINSSKPIVLFVGTLIRRKRPEIFVKVAKQHPELEFLLVGRNGDSTALADAKGFLNVHWIPNLSREEIATVMASSDIFLFPSIHEPCAAVIPEALASGLVLLASKDCGNAELIRNGIDGILIEQSEAEIEKFDQQLTELIKNPALKKHYSEAARKRCVETLNWDAVAKQYEKVFQSL